MSPLTKPEAKQELAGVAIEKYRLSYTIQTFSGHDHWDLQTYTLYKDDFGHVRIEDDDTGTAVITYDGPVKWWLEYNCFGTWDRYIPEEVYGEWKTGTSAKWKDVPGGGWSGS